MTPRILFTSLIVLSSSVLAAAGDSATQTEGYTPKKRSSFAVPSTGRAPFWPIGWTPQSEARAEVVAPKVTLDPEMFAVTSILMGNPSMAVINGRAYGEGEALRMPRAAKADAGAVPRVNLPPGVRIVVQRILDGRVVLQADKQSVTVPLRRPELSQRKAEDVEEQLLSLDDR
jgi:hypothetical protein